MAGSETVRVVAEVPAGCLDEMRAAVADVNDIGTRLSAGGAFVTFGSVQGHWRDHSFRLISAEIVAGAADGGDQT